MGASKTEIDAETETLGLIGNPVDHSLSPPLHNWLIERLDWNYAYLAFRVEGGRVEEALRGARALGFAGLNVTIPHKEAAARAVDELSEASRATGAVNTVIFSEGKLRGHTTDPEGFLSSLKLRGFRPRGKKALLFGAGGAAAAVAYGLLRAGVSRLIVCNRTLERAEKLVERLEKRSSGIELEAVGLEEGQVGRLVRDSRLVINATPLGMGADRGKAVWGEVDDFGSDQLVYDLVYNPRRTEFLKLAERGGAEIVGGLDMLILQGVESLGLWTGREIEAERYLPELRSLLRGLLEEGES